MRESRSLIELIYEKEWEDVEKCLMDRPEEASMQIIAGGNTTMCLHEAVKCQPPLGVIQSLLEVHEEAVLVHDHSGCLPIHLACKCGASARNVIGPLIEAYPPGLRHKDMDGKIPLHIACEWGAPAEAVNLILINYPEGIYVPSTNAKLTAFDYLESEKIIKNASNKKHILTVLSLAESYCAVAKAASTRTYHEVDSKIKALANEHSIEIAKLESKHYDEINIHYQREAQHRAEVKTMKACLNNTNEKSIQNATAMEKTLQMVQKERDQLKLDLAVEKGRNNHLMDEIESSKFSNDASHMHDKAKLSSEIQELKMMHSREKVEFQQEVEDLHSQINRLEISVEAKDSEIEKLHERMEAFRKLERSLANQMKDSEMKSEETKKDIESMVEHTNEIKNENTRLRKEKKTMEKRCTKHLDTIMHLRKACTTMSEHVCLLLEKEHNVKKVLESQGNLLQEAASNRVTVLEMFESSNRELNNVAQGLNAMWDETDYPTNIKYRRSSDPTTLNQNIVTITKQNDNADNRETPAPIPSRPTHMRSKSSGGKKKIQSTPPTPDSQKSISHKNPKFKYDSPTGINSFPPPIESIPIEISIATLGSQES